LFDNAEQTRNSVFHETSEKVAVVRQSVGKWWTVVENEFVAPLCAGVPRRNAGSKGVVAFPTRKNTFFQAGKIRLGVNLRVCHAVRLEATATLDT